MPLVHYVKELLCGRAYSMICTKLKPTSGKQTEIAHSVLRVSFSYTPKDTAKIERRKGRKREQELGNAGEHNRRRERRKERHSKKMQIHLTK